MGNQAPSQTQTFEAVVDFITAQTWAESKQIVESQRNVLLTDAADQIFDVLLEQYNFDEDEARFLNDRRALLMRCRSEGIDAAFAGRLHRDEFPVLLSELSRLTRLSDMPRKVRVCRAALMLVDHDVPLELRVLLQLELANSLAQNPLGDQAENREEAIAYNQQALEVYTRNTFPENWAMIQLNLGNVYGLRIRGERAANLEQAIAHYQQALEVCTREAFPEQWALIQYNLGNAYVERIRGERAANLEQAITYFQQTLEVRTHDAFPEQWAMTQTSLGTAYRQRIRGERAANLEQAIAHHRLSQKIYSREAFPEQWATTHIDLANDYANRIRGERAANLEQAIAHFQQALEVYTRDAFPERWALTQRNLGNAYHGRIRGERAANLEQASSCYQQALEIYTRDAFPEQWAGTQRDLASTYIHRIRGERAANLEQAIAHFQQALEVYTRNAFPERWAMTRHNLGNAYRERIRGERAVNLEQAIAHYQRAREVMRRDAFPEQWAEIQHNLGNAYSSRIRGERAENLEQAIAHFQEALEVRTREAFPEQWALTQCNLGIAYVERIRGERADNLEQAIAYYQRALEVYTREAFPEQWAGTQHELGVAYLERVRGQRADNLEQAIAHYQRALQVYPREVYPEQWAMTQMSLGIIYEERIRGERADNLEQAIAHYQGALQVYTREAYPEQWAITQHNLGNAYRQRIRGERAANLEQAIAYMRRALKIRTRRAFPEQWALTQYNLGITYVERIRGEWAANLKRAIAHYQQALEVMTLERFPAHYQRTLRTLGDLHFAMRNWAEAHAAYAKAIEAGDILLEAAYTETGRQAEVGETSRLHARAAYCLLQRRRPAQSVLRLEQGKTRLLAEALALGDADLAALPDAQRLAMLAARRAVRELEAEMRPPPNTPARRSDAELGQLLRQARIDLNLLIKSIRAQHAHFMPTGLDLPEILALIPEGGTLVAPVVTSQGSAVFVLPYGTKTVTAKHVIRLDAFTDDDLHALLLGSLDNPGWLRTYATYLGSQQQDEKIRRAALEAWQVALETLTSRLWSVLMGRVHKRLTALRLVRSAPVVLMPQGGLGLLPLHAAWRAVHGVKRAFLDDYTVLYAPSAYTLGICRRRLQRDWCSRRTLLAAVNPTADLPYTPSEGAAVARLFAPEMRCILVEGKATPQAVRDAVSGRTYVHFACHGFYDWQEAMQSGLLLANSHHLSLAEVISRLDLGATRLVTLSACETGLTEFVRSPDEYLGLPAGFLQAGATGVLSTLWAVNDLSTMLLMEHFYTNHLGGMTPAAAMQAAQQWMRGVTAGELAERFAMERKSESDRLMSYDQASEAWQHFTYDFDEDERPYVHPVYWAAFTFTGL